MMKTLNTFISNPATPPPKNITYWFSEDGSSARCCFFLKTSHPWQQHLRICAWHTEIRMASRRCFVGRAFFGSFSFALWTLDPSRWRRTGVSCPDAWHVGCGIIPKGSGSLKFLYRFRFISLLLKLSMGIIFLASSFSLILGWCGISFFFLNHVEYFFLRKFEKRWKRAGNLQFEEQWMKCQPPLGGKIPFWTIGR